MNAKLKILLVLLMANIIWTPQPRQAMCLERWEKEILFGGARFGGKSETGRAWLCEKKYAEHPGYRGLVIRKNATDLVEWIEKARIFMRPCHVKITGNPPVIKFPKGGVVWLGHLKDENAYEKYQGWELQKILIEEATQIPRESDYEKLISSSRSTVAGLKAQVLLTANPGGPGHVWVKNRFSVKKPFKTVIVNPDAPKDLQIARIFIPAKVKDNPIGCKADPQYVSQLMSIKDKKLREAWLNGNWDVFSGQFFDMWDESVHVIEPFKIPKNWPRFRGIDWGYYPGYAACGWIAVDYDGNHYKYREFYEQQNVPSIFAQKIISRTGDERIIKTLADPSMWAKDQYGSGASGEKATTKSIQQHCEDAGLYLEKANNDRVSGWNNFRELLYWDENHAPKLRIFDTCEHTIRTLPGLVHDDNNVEDLDTDGEDHLADEDRYIFMHTYKPGKPKDAQTEMEQFIDSITEPSEKWNTA